MTFKTTRRQLEQIVPKQYKKTFSLYQEEEPTFNLAAAPKKADAMPADEPMTVPENPDATEPTATEEPVQDKEKSGWMVKKLVGLLRYCGAMAIEVRGAIPDEAYEIVDKIQDELEKIAKSLEPYLINEPEETPEETTEEPAEEPSAEETPVEEPVEEPSAEEPQTKFKRKVV